MKYTFHFFCGNLRKKALIFRFPRGKKSENGVEKFPQKESIYFGIKIYEKSLSSIYQQISKRHCYRILTEIFFFRDKNKMREILNLHLVNDRLSSDKIKTNNLNQVNKIFLIASITKW